MTHNNRESLLKKNEEVNQDQMSEGNFESLDSCKAVSIYIILQINFF